MAWSFRWNNIVPITEYAKYKFAKKEKKKTQEKKSKRESSHKEYLVLQLFSELTIFYVE